MRDIGTIAFIGAGKMATAIAKGLITDGMSADKIRFFDISEKSVKAFSEVTGIKNSSPNLPEAVKPADVILLAVKPQNVPEALREVKGELNGKLLISICAGITTTALEDLSGCDRVIRVMPNTPALVGAGVSAYSPAINVADEDIAVAETILKAVGACCLVEEKLMDAVTGLSGSGPAYVFDFIQALADGGVNSGLSRDLALQLAARTVAGAAKLVLETGKHPTELRDQVTSPGGTTAKALAVLEIKAFRGIVAEAVNAAAKRSAELGKS